MGIACSLLGNLHGSILLSNDCVAYPGGQASLFATYNPPVIPSAVSAANPHEYHYQVISCLSRVFL